MKICCICCYYICMCPMLVHIMSTIVPSQMLIYILSTNCISFDFVIIFLTYYLIMILRNNYTWNLLICIFTINSFMHIYVHLNLIYSYIYKWYWMFGWTVRNNIFSFHDRQIMIFSSKLYHIILLSVVS